MPLDLNVDVALNWCVAMLRSKVALDGQGVPSAGAVNKLTILSRQSGRWNVDGCPLVSMEQIWHRSDAVDSSA